MSKTGALYMSELQAAHDIIDELVKALEYFLAVEKFATYSGIGTDNEHEACVEKAKAIIAAAKGAA